MENRFVKCANYINYTWQHKKAFLRVEMQCRGFNSLRGYLHDVDKLFRYLAFLWGRFALLHHDCTTDIPLPD